MTPSMLPNRPWRGVMAACWLVAAGGAFGAEPLPRASRLPTVVAVPAELAADDESAPKQERDLSERLRLIPELGWRDRGNAAQDTQVQSRGFGARASFGIRGIRLFLDDVPLSANDGQGSVAAIPVYGLGDVEFVPAPQSLRYGNAAGGVLMTWSPLIASGAEQQFRALASVDQQGVDARVARRTASHLPGFSATLGWLRADGDRPHSAGCPDDQTLRWRWSLNLLDVPEAEDPLGISAAQWQSGIVGDPAAVLFNTRKSVRSGHTGFSLAVPTPIGEWQQSAWMGRREVEQFLSIPVAVQANPRHPGGVIDLQRDQGGLIGSLRLERGFSIGWEWAQTREQRLGFENFSGQELGVRGRLRRRETNDLQTFDLFVGQEHQWSDDWSVDAGVRYGDWRLKSRDRFPGNGDDSGTRNLDTWSGSLRLVRAPDGPWRQAWSIGTGREPATLNELAYRADGSAGINVALDPARSTALEWRHEWPGDQDHHTLSLWQIQSRGEIVPAQSSGGRASFQNAGRTRRRGIEFAMGFDIQPQHRIEGSFGLIDARFTEGFEFVAGTERRLVAVGRRLPGIAAQQAQAAWLAEWRDRDATRVSVNWIGRTAADDRNTVFAPGFATVDVLWRHQFAPDFSVQVELGNLFDRRAIGSVIVNEANARFLEPAAGRRIWWSLQWSPE
ncbi:MAG: TonB-dependent receptor [Ahniella sp.]|nr:TonB-dependent receptor [Ahniella sp.]